MIDDLLRYYQEELSYLNLTAGEFAAAYPKIAGRLQMGNGATKDPHVERLIQAFAFLNARIRHKLDDEFPEITEAFLNVLYPHYLAPIPSAAIVRFALDPAQGATPAGYTVPRGSEVETAHFDGATCRFQTCYPVTLWPLKLREVVFQGQPISAPPTRFQERAKGALRLSFECTGKQVNVAQLRLERLRFFLHGGGQFVHTLYEFLFTSTLGIAVAESADDREPVLRSADCLRPVGFERDESLLDYPKRSFAGYRLLSEFFAFREKFLFFDLVGLDGDALARRDGRFDVYVFFDRESTALERNVTRDMLQLGCTPIVNLYKQRAEPIRLSQQKTEYQVVPDARRPAAHEVHSITSVRAIGADGDEVAFQPFFSIKHAAAGERSTSAEGDRPRAFWHASRRPAVRGSRRPTDEESDRGTEVFLTLVDLDSRAAAPDEWTLDVDVTCVNRDLPGSLPYGVGQPALQLTVAAPLSSISCLTKPTPTLRPFVRGQSTWRLISHLALNHLSLVDYEEGADALREILELYDFHDTAETRTLIQGLKSVRGERIVGRVDGAQGSGFCRGVEVRLHFDESRYVGAPLFLFASVLERFLGLYSSINSFTRTVATTTMREAPLKKWPPRAGEQLIV